MPSRLPRCFSLRFGVVYHGYRDGQLDVTFTGRTRLFSLHQTLEFDSDRKCMSVIVETDKGESPQQQLGQLSFHYKEIRSNSSTS